MKITWNLFSLQSYISLQVEQERKREREILFLLLVSQFDMSHSDEQSSREWILY